MWAHTIGSPNQKYFKSTSRWGLHCAGAWPGQMDRAWCVKKRCHGMLLREDPALAIYHLHFGEQHTTEKMINRETHVWSFSFRKQFPKSSSPKFPFSILIPTFLYYCGLCNCAKATQSQENSPTLLSDFWLSIVLEMCIKCEMCMK